jgi:hypothetical protein
VLEASTKLLGHLDVTYDYLVGLLGQPGPAADQYRSWAQWRLHTPHGVVTVYDYGVRPRGRKDLISQWHLGATNGASAEWIAAYLRIAFRAAPQYFPPD